MFYRSYSPLRCVKGCPFMQNSMKITCFLPFLFKILMLQQTNFLIVTKLYPLNFYKVQIFTNYETIIFKLVLSIVLATWGTILPVIREITPICIKTYNFKIKSGMCKRSVRLLVINVTLNNISVVL